MDRDEMRERSARAVSFLEDEGPVSQIAERFAGKYALAVMGAPSDAAAERAWGAFRYYLLARPTLRKPWGLTAGQTEQVIAELRRVVEETA